MRSLKRQRGAVLFVSILMLAVLTLFVLSSINISSGDLRIVGNMQSKLSIEQNTQQAIEQILSNVANFQTPAAQNLTVNSQAVAVAMPACLEYQQATGYSAVSSITLYDTKWSVTAAATDPVTGATASLTQGVRIRLPTNYCP